MSGAKGDSILFTKSQEAAKGGLWRKLANLREFKRRSALGIEDPHEAHDQKASTEEEQETLKGLEHKIHALKSSENPQEHHIKPPIREERNYYNDRPSDDDEVLPQALRDAINRRNDM